MIAQVYTGEYCEGSFARVRAEQDLMEAKLELASLRELCVRVLEVGGLALHCNFISGDEPKWKHDSQRSHLIGLSNLFEELHSEVTGGKS